MSNVQLEPGEIVDPPPQPLLSARRVAIVLTVVAATAALLVFGRGESGDSGGTGCTHPDVVAFVPCPGSRVLRQSSVGVQLEPGFDGRIAINGVAVPEEQMEGAVVPGTEAYERLSPEERELGPRPNTKDVVRFRPDDGKVVEQLSGEVQVTVTYWPLAEGQGSAETLSYTLFVT